MTSKKLAIIGLWFLLSIAILYAGIAFLKGISVFSTSHTYYTSFSDANRVSVSARIYLNGYNVGNVTKIDYDFANNSRTVFALSINKKVRLPIGTIAMINPTMLSGVQIDLLLPDGPVAGYYKSGDTIPSSDFSSDVMQTVSKKVMPSVLEILPKLDSTVQSINAILRDPNIKATVANMAATTKEVSSIVSKVNRAADGLEPIIEQMRLVAANAEKLSNAVDPQQLNEIIRNLEDGSHNLRNFMSRVDNPNSSLGKLINEKELYIRIDSLVTTTEQLISDVKKNPKRYINLSVF